MLSLWRKQTVISRQALVTLSGDSAGRKIGYAVAFGDAMWLAVERDLRAETAYEAIGIDTIIL